MMALYSAVHQGSRWNSDNVTLLKKKKILGQVEPQSSLVGMETNPMPFANL